MFKTCSQKWDNLVFQNEMGNMSSAFRVYVSVLKTKATKWCPLEQTKCKSDEISVQLTIF